MFNHKLTNLEVLQKLDEMVYGHTDAKKMLINLVYRSRLSYYRKYGLLLSDDKIKPVNCMLTGASGTGKTHLVESLQKIIGFPFLRYDALQIAPESAKGDLTVNKIVADIRALATDRLTLGCGFSIDGIISQTIVFIDEFDKLAQSFDSSGNWNKHVQGGLLQLLENKLSVKGVSFVLAGAFVDLDKHLKKQTKSLGFNPSQQTEDEIEDYETSVIGCGLLPEIVGRIHNIVKLDVLSYNDYITILHQRLIPQKLEELSIFGVTDYVFDLNLMEKIAKKAVKSDMGVRYLNKALDKIVQDVQFGCDEHLNPLRLVAPEAQNENH